MPIIRASKKAALLKKVAGSFPEAIRKKLPKEIGVIEVSEKESFRINRRYRKKRTSANVLSFLYGKEYGEIIVCPAVVRREARAARNSYEYQMTWMIVHGMIHLTGMHHEKSESVARRTEAIEKRILERIFQHSNRSHDGNVQITINKLQTNHNKQ